MITDKEINFLKLVQEKIDPKAIIAGGAIRDHLLGQKYKDVDIFLPMDSERDFDCDGDEIFGLSDYGDGISFHMNDGEDIYPPGRGQVHSVWDVFKDEVLYQLIFVPAKVPTNWIRTHFDCSVCQAYHDGNDFHVSPMCEADMAAKKITIYQKAIDQRWNLNHVLRISKKLQFPFRTKYYEGVDAY